MRDNILRTYQNRTFSEQSLECEKFITEKELFEALKGMPNNKSSGNDGLTKEFFKKCCSEVKKTHFYHVLYTLLTKKNYVPHKYKKFSYLIYPKLYQKASRMFFRHLFQLINPLMFMEDSLVKVDV